MIAATIAMTTIGIAPAGSATTTVAAALAFAPGLAGGTAFYAAVLFVLNVAHAGVRIGRKTHVVDIGGGHKAEYVALTNSIIGVLLLVIGGAVGALLALGLEAALAALSILALLGAVTAMRMRHAQEG